MPLAWRDDWQLDEGMLERNCQRYLRDGVAGTYTADSDGEFYALEIEDFKRMVKAFAQAIEPTGLDVAMGVTWCNTEGVAERIKVCLDAGIPNVHVAHPYWVPLANGEVDRFFEDIANASPAARWIHYAHFRPAPMLTGRDYARLAKRYPDQMIGTKLGTANLRELHEIFAFSPQLAHFCTDPNLSTGMLLGGKGVYSYWFNTLPKWHTEFYQCCERGDWEEAVTRQKRLVRWETEHLAEIFAAGHMHAPVTKALAALSGFLEDHHVTRPPYYAADPAVRMRMQEAFDQFWAEELALEDFQ